MKAYFNTRVLAVFILATALGTLGASVMNDYQQCRANGYSTSTCSR